MSQQIRVYDTTLRDGAQSEGVSFSLDDKTVDRLIEVGGRLLRESPDFKQFLDAAK